MHQFGLKVLAGLRLSNFFAFVFYLLSSIFFLCQHVAAS